MVIYWQSFPGSLSVVDYGVFCGMWRGKTVWTLSYSPHRDWMYWIS